MYTEPSMKLVWVTLSGESLTRGPPSRVCPATDTSHPNTPGSVHDNLARNTLTPDTDNAAEKKASPPIETKEDSWTTSVAETGAWKATRDETLQLEVPLTKARRIERVLSSSTSFCTDRDPVTNVFPLTEKVSPAVTSEKTLTVDPKFPWSRTEKLAPVFAAPAIERVPDTVASSFTDKADPARASRDMDTGAPTIVETVLCPIDTVEPI
jgi:hypothetical protein